MTPLLAELGPTDHPYLLYAVVLGVVGLAVFIRNVLGSVKDWTEMRRHNAGGDYATKQDLREVHGRVDTFSLTLAGELGKMRGEVLSELREQRAASEEHRGHLTEDITAIHRSLGRVEGLESIIDGHGKSIESLQNAMLAAARVQHKPR